MSSISVNTITDASGGATTSINGFTPTVSNMAGRNRIINGDMRIDQRNAGASVTSITSSTYTLDRWKLDIGGTGTFTMQQSTSAPAGFSNSLSLTCTSATASPNVIYLEQKIEGFNLSDFAFNTASAATFTISFWVKSNKTGTYVVLPYNTSATRMIGKTYTINSANTWEQKTLTFVGDTAAAIPNSNANGLEIRFWLAAGSTWSSGTLPSTWASDVTANEAAGQTVNLADTTSNTFYITGVQLEEGSVATPFCPAGGGSYGAELALCQRYYEKQYEQSVVPGTNLGNDQQSWFTALAGSSTNRYSNSVPFKVTKRTRPTLSFWDYNGASGQWKTGAAGQTETATTVAGSHANENAISTVWFATGNNWAYGFWTASAEL